ncbi:hypothetical protein [Paraburkholderia sp. J67]|uniref:hypothetical protein n=1 Tax=Paraburkholderia sp. J67 TaxID=2805435 RepID=UPI002ABD8267|nr:hypothetical protein [Paraburkholderia sp. J67]
MSSASDIANLFGVAGGSPAQYQEVERTEQTQGTRGSWAALPAAELIPCAAPLVEAAPLETAQADTTPIDAPHAADEVHAEVLAVAPEPDSDAAPDADPDAPQRLIAWTIAASAAEPPPVVVAVPEVGAVAESEAVSSVAFTAPAPAVVAATSSANNEPQPAALSSVFARLLARNESRDDVPPTGTP